MSSSFNFLDTFTISNISVLNSVYSSDNCWCCTTEKALLNETLIIIMEKCSKKNVGKIIKFNLIHPAIFPSNPTLNLMLHQEQSGTCSFISMWVTQIVDIGVKCFCGSWQPQQQQQQLLHVTRIMSYIAFPSWWHQESSHQ